MSLFDFKRLLAGSRAASAGAEGLLMGENFPWAVEKCMEWPPPLLPQCAKNKKSAKIWAGSCEL